VQGKAATIHRPDQERRGYSLLTEKNLRRTTDAPHQGGSGITWFGGSIGYEQQKCLAIYPQY
jgi:hypothetical protein